jgi:hypothetical protein
VNKNFAAISIMLLIGLSTIADGDGPPPARATDTRGVPPDGAVIAHTNVDQFSAAIPPGLAFAIRHGLTITVAPTRRIEWPLAYQSATEKYSGQVALDEHDAIRNYVAGLPFPLIDTADPRAGVKVAYNWRWGPFIPREASVDSAQKTKAYTVSPTEPDELIGDDSQRDYRNENDCDRMTFLLLRSGPNSDSPAAHGPIDYKERGDACGPDRAAVIAEEYIDPQRNDDIWFYIPAVRRWRQQQIRGGYPHQSCTYSCVQFSWEYAPPKTEVYDYRLTGKQPMLACLDAPAIGAGIADASDPAHFTQLNCEVRDAYVLEMRPRDTTSEVILPARVYVDSETYLYLGAEFFRDPAPDSDVPIWGRHTNTAGDTVMLLANDFYVPGDKPNFLISLNLTSGSEEIDAGDIPAALFNPRAEEMSDGRM